MTLYAIGCRFPVVIVLNQPIACQGKKTAKNFSEAEINVLLFSRPFCRANSNGRQNGLGLPSLVLPWFKRCCALLLLHKPHVCIYCNTLLINSTWSLGTIRLNDPIVGWSNSKQSPFLQIEAFWGFRLGCRLQTALLKTERCIAVVYGPAELPAEHSPPSPCTRGLASRGSTVEPGVGGPEVTAVGICLVNLFPETRAGTPWTLGAGEDSSCWDKKGCSHSYWDPASSVLH